MWRAHGASECETASQLVPRACITPSRLQGIPRGVSAARRPVRPRSPRPHAMMATSLNCGALHWLSAIRQRIVGSRPGLRPSLKGPGKRDFGIDWKALCRLGSKRKASALFADNISLILTRCGFEQQSTMTCADSVCPSGSGPCSIQRVRFRMPGLWLR